MLVGIPGRASSKSVGCAVCANGAGQKKGTESCFFPGGTGAAVVKELIKGW